VAGSGLVIGIGVLAFFLLRAPAPVLAGYPSNFYKDLQFERMVPLRAMIVQPAKVTREPVKAVRAKARTGRTGNGSTAPGSVDMAPQVDLSFGGEEVANGRPLAQSDLEAIQKTVAPRLIRCFRAEAERNSAFTGGSVFVYVMPRGAAQVSRIDTTPAPSAELTSCARNSTAGVKVEPFSGAAQVMQIPLHVAQ
jgi:hypothetical protein